MPADEISSTATADVDDVEHTPEMDRDLAVNYLDFVLRKQTKEDGVASHGRMYDPVHHGKLWSYWAAASQAYSAILKGMRKYSSGSFIKPKPSKQLFKIMMDEMSDRRMPPFTPKGPVLRKKSR
jgi:hypothetical protein